MSGPSDELSEEEEILTHIENLEQDFGKIISEHKDILKEEKDVVAKLEVARSLINNSENITMMLTEQGIENDELVGDLELEFAHLVAFLQGIAMEVSEVNQKISKEDEDLTDLTGIESEINEEAEKLLQHHEAIFGDRLKGPKDIPQDLAELAKGYKVKEAGKAKSDLYEKAGLVKYIDR